MNKFEIVLLFSPDLPTSSLKSEIEKFKKKLSDNSAKIVGQEDWGLRDLSYKINKFKKAFYNFFQVEMDGYLVKNFNKDLNQSDILLRYLFVKVNQHQELPTHLNNEKK